MPIKNVKNLGTPIDPRQCQITDYFRVTGLSSNKRKTSEDCSQANMPRKLVFNDSDDDFMPIELPFPMHLSFENEAPETSKTIENTSISNPIRKKRVSKTREKTSARKKSNKCISRKDHDAKASSVSCTVEILETPKKCSLNSSDNDLSASVENGTPVKQIKIDTKSERENLNVSFQISFSPDAPQCSRNLDKISCENSLSTPTKKNKNPCLINCVSAEQLDTSASSTSVKSSKLEDDKGKLNTQQTELLKELFKNTVENNKMKMLLNDADIAVVEGFLKMDINYQYFLMKLFTFQPSWYNMMKFCNQIKLDSKLSVEDIMTMYKYHKSNIYVDTDLTRLNTKELLNMLMLGNLKQIVKKLKVKTDNNTKLGIIHALNKFSKTQATLTKRKSSEDILRDNAFEHLGYCIKLKDDVRTSFQKAYILQTYTNPLYYGDIQNYFRDAGYMKVVYPSYGVENFIPFNSREAFSRFFEAISMKIELEGAFKKKDITSVRNICAEAFEELKNIDDIAKWRRSYPKYLHKFSAEYQYIRIINKSIDKLTKYYLDVKIWLQYLIDNYPTNHAVGFWYKHLAHIITRNEKNYNYAAQIIIKAYEIHKKKNIFDCLQVFELNKFAKKFRSSRVNKVSTLYRDQLAELSEFSDYSENFPETFIKAWTDRRETPGKRIYRYRDSKNELSYGSVETIALQHYASEQNFEGIHCEGHLIALLFALLFWDIIYIYYVPNTFISKVQNAPLDMYGSSFYDNRKEEIDSRLKEIATEWSEQQLETTLRNNWNDHSHEQSFVNFESFMKDVEAILKIVRCFNRTVLSKILGRLASNYSRYRSGLPDLFLWNTEESKCKFVEVKGEKDKLQTNQILWINYLLEVGANVEVCYVSGVGAMSNLCKEQETANDMEKEDSE